MHRDCKNEERVTRCLAGQDFAVRDKGPSIATSVVNETIDSDVSIVTKCITSIDISEIVLSTGFRASVIVYL